MGRCFALRNCRGGRRSCGCHCRNSREGASEEAQAKREDLRGPRPDQMVSAVRRAYTDDGSAFPHFARGHRAVEPRSVLRASNPGACRRLRRGHVTAITDCAPLSNETLPGLTFSTELRGGTSWFQRVCGTTGTASSASGVYGFRCRLLTPSDALGGSSERWAIATLASSLAHSALCGRANAILTSTFGFALPLGSRAMLPRRCVPCHASCR